MHQQAADIFQKLASDLDTEGRYLFLNALANQLRFPNNHTHYFSCILLYLFDQNAKVHSPTLCQQWRRYGSGQHEGSNPHR